MDSLFYSPLMNLLGLIALHDLFTTRLPSQSIVFVLSLFTQAQLRNFRKVSECYIHYERNLQKYNLQSPKKGYTMRQIFIMIFSDVIHQSESKPRSGVIGTGIQIWPKDITDIETQNSALTCQKCHPFLFNLYSKWCSRRLI